MNHVLMVIEMTTEALHAAFMIIPLELKIGGSTHNVGIGDCN
jgi:hypothetical protein